MFQFHAAVVAAVFAGALAVFAGFGVLAVAFAVAAAIVAHEVAGNPVVAEVHA